MIEISIIIPTLNRFKILKKALHALTQQSISSQRFEVIVINDESDDLDYEEFNQLPIQFPSLGLILLNQKREGAAKARNLSLEYAKGIYILFLGDDMLAHPKLIAQHLSTHLIYPNDAVLGFIDWDPDLPLTSVMHSIAPYGHQFNYQIQNPLNCGYQRFYTSNLSVPKSLLEQENFSNQFKGCGYEDTELGYRLEKKGMKIIYNSLAITYHHHYHNEQTFIKRQYSTGKNLPILLRLHPELKPHFQSQGLFSHWVKRFIAKLRRNQLLYYYHEFELACHKGYLEANHPKKPTEK